MAGRMAGEAAIGWVRYWVSEEVSVRVAGGLAQVLGERNRVHSIDENGDNGAMVTHIVCLPAAYERLKVYEKMVGELLLLVLLLLFMALLLWKPLV
jgi:hypothetical protein